MTYNGTKRFISVRRGGDVLELKNEFLKEFSDVLPRGVTSQQVKLQKYEKDFMELADGEEVPNGLKATAYIRDKKVQTFCAVSDSYSIQCYCLKVKQITN